MNDEVFVPEEGSEGEGNPGNEGEVLESLKALQEEVRELREEISADDPVESILENEAFRDLIRDANAATLERLIADTPGLDDGVQKALRLTLDKMRETGDGDEEGLGQGERVLALRRHIRKLDEELKLTAVDSGFLDRVFTEKTDEEEADEKKLAVLLTAERDKAAQELREILAALPDAEPEEDPDDKWSR